MAKALKPLKENDRLSVSVKLRYHKQEVYSADIYIQSNEKYAGILRIVVKNGSWKTSYRVEKTIETTGYFGDLVKKIKNCTDFNEFKKILSDEKIMEKLQEVEFLSEKNT